MNAPSLQPGVTGHAELVAAPEHAAAAMVGGAVATFSTPSMISLMEVAAFNAVLPLLSEGQVTVGTVVNIRHLAATPLGLGVRAEAELVRVDGRRLVFRVTAFDDAERIGEGEHERFIVDVPRFMDRVQSKLRASGAGS